MRAPIFLTVREDKPPSECKIEIKEHLIKDVQDSDASNYRTSHTQQSTYDNTQTNNKQSFSNLDKIFCQVLPVESETAQCGFVRYNDLQVTMTIIEQTCLWKRNYDLIHIASVNDVKGSIFLNIGYSLSINHYLCFESKLFSLVIMTDNSNLQLLSTHNFIQQNLAKRLGGIGFKACTCTKLADILQVKQGNEHVVRGIRIIFQVNARGNGSIVICDTFPLTYVTTQDILSEFLNFMKSVMQLKINWRRHLNVLKDYSRMLNAV